MEITKMKVTKIASDANGLSFNLDFNLGVIGFSRDIKGTNWEFAARKYLNGLYDSLEEKYGKNVCVVSGLTNVGIPAIAYELAAERKFSTIGVACKKAEEYDLFPVDSKIMVGENWGDESQAFLNSLDAIVKIGGGEQSKKEIEMARNMKDIVIFEGIESEKDCEEIINGYN